MSEETQPQDETVNLIDSLMSMHKHEREDMFKLFMENKELFQKLMPNFDFLNVATDPTTEIDHPLIRHFQAWSRK